MYQTLNIDFYSTTIKNNKKIKSVYFANMLVCKSKYKINDFTKSAKPWKILNYSSLDKGKAILVKKWK